MQFNCDVRDKPLRPVTLYMACPKINNYFNCKSTRLMEHLDNCNIIIILSKAVISIIMSKAATHMTNSVVKDT